MKSMLLVNNCTAIMKMAAVKALTYITGHLQTENNLQINFPPCLHPFSMQYNDALFLYLYACE
jgi:hypothetical protein